MVDFHFPWLQLAILTPLLGAFLISRVRDLESAQKLAVGICACTLFWAAGAWIDFNTLHKFQAHDHWDVVQMLVGKQVFALDELSAPLFPLAALVYLVTSLSTLKTKLSRVSYEWILVAESILLATLSCIDRWPLIALLALATVPPWIELRARKQSTRIFTLHMGLFIILLIVGQILVDRSSANSSNLLAGAAMLAVASLLRNGVFPLHCWMTDLFEKATFGTALLFVTPMTGAYAIMRLAVPISPGWALQAISMVSLATAIYAAGMALVQHEARRFFCFLFLSNASLVLVGLELATPIGLTGGLCVWLSVSLSLAGFGLTLRSVEGRTGRILLDEYHGLYENAPTLAALFLITGLASIGFPGTIGFVGTELLIKGASEVNAFVGFAVVAVAALNGIAILYAYFRVFTGTKHVAWISLQCRLPERIAVLTVIFLVLGAGLWPQPGVASRYHAAKELIEQSERGQSKHDTSPLVSKAEPRPESANGQ